MSTPLATPAADTTADVIVRRDGRAGRLTLNRPHALNALTHGMIQTIAATLRVWATDPAVEVVIIDGAGDRAFCAGGDVIAFYDSRTLGTEFAETFWADEYRLNAAIHRYPKPYVAVMDGFVMGGGVGLSAHARFRIVTEKSTVAMPETTIGLIPDVGGTWLLSRAQGAFGAYIGLTGYRMTGSDAIQAGFADTYLPRADIAGLIAALANPHAAPVLEILDQARDDNPVPQSPLSTHADVINRLFAGATMLEIERQLLSSTHDVAQRALADLKIRSPLALGLTLAAIHRAKKLTQLEAALAVEYRLCNHLFRRGEFTEGIRALLVDKDKAPKWQPRQTADVTPELMAEYFAPLPSGREVLFAGAQR